MKLKFTITALLIVMTLNNTVEAQTKTKPIKQDQALSKPTQSIQILRDELAYQTTQTNTLQTIKFFPRFLTETVGGGITQ